MFTLYKLTIASIKMFFRNRQAIFFTFFTPLLIMVIFGAIGFDRAPTVNVGIAISGNTSVANQQFIDQLRNVPYFKLSYGSLEVQKKALVSGDRSLVIDLTPVETSPLTIYKNAMDAQAGTALSVISQMLDKTTIAQAQAKPVIALNVEDLNASNLKYIDFLLPGLVALSVMQLSVFSVAFVFVDYKEKGILKRILATPIKPFQFVIPNIITRLIVSVIQASFFIAVGVFLFGVTIVGSLWLIALCVILGAIMFLGLGFTISGLAKTTESVPAFANLIVFPMLFLGGTFFPIDAMPMWLQYISKVLPLTYFSTAVREVMNKGASFVDIYPNLIVMAIWAIVLVFLAILTFRFEEKRGA